ncbi:succinate dehydrogenase cytochrome b subunit [Granulicoccus phenolivorans]|uniref:succinate dehydrogenase cytochrome b subunit n=1 Tax=Granulicoccus phenolivorans TaxID=266854 RepID=UPI00247FADB9|nr:succinate dehydrogenase cytochrome b subunit [Granulicoccus phenolivorans]
MSSVATSSLTVKQRAGRSTVALKVWMACSGLVMVLYLLAHMYGNLKIIAGPEAFNHYAHYLRVILEPLLPESGLLWIIRVVLLVAVLIHIYCGMTLWARDRKAVGGGTRYAVKKNVQRTGASFTMRWGGIAIALFVIFHLFNFTFKAGDRTQTPTIANTAGNYDLMYRLSTGEMVPNAYQMVHNSFEQWWLVLIYFLALIAVGLHLRHGVWSAFATLGANTSPNVRRNWNIVAWIVLLVIVVGFMVPPVAILLGVI